MTSPPPCRSSPPTPPGSSTASASPSTAATPSTDAGGRGRHPGGERALHRGSVTSLRPRGLRGRWHPAGVAADAMIMIIGDEELLVDRAIGDVVASVRAADPETEVVDLAPAALEPGRLTELTSPSLFGGGKVL